MLKKDAVKILEALLTSCDPSNREVLEQLAEAATHRDSVREALITAIKNLESPKSKPNEKRPPLWPLPDNHPLSRRLYKGDKPIEIARELKAEYGSHLVFVQNGYFWETYENDAYSCAEIFGWRIATIGSNHVFTGAPTNAFRFKEKLTEQRIPYIIVAQVECPSTGPLVERRVVELFNPFGSNSPKLTSKKKFVSKQFDTT